MIQLGFILIDLRSGFTSKKLYDHAHALGIHILVESYKQHPSVRRSVCDKTLARIETRMNGPCKALEILERIVAVDAGETDMIIARVKLGRREWREHDIRHNQPFPPFFRSRKPSITFPISKSRFPAHSSPSLCPCVRGNVSRRLMGFCSD